MLYANSLIAGTAAHYRVTVGQILSRSRRRILVVARHDIACQLQDAGWFTTDIGAILRRDHSTITSLLKGGKGKFCLTTNRSLRTSG